MAPEEVYLAVVLLGVITATPVVGVETLAAVAHQYKNKEAEMEVEVLHIQQVLFVLYGQAQLEVSHQQTQVICNQE